MKKLTLATAALAAGLALAACGSDDPGAAGDDVASLGTATTAPPASTPASGSVDPQQAMLDYASCMRDNGIDMPDPEFASAAGGGVIAKQVAGGGDEGRPAFDPASQAFKDADAECQPLLRDAIGTIDIDPEQQAEMREQALAFSQCMRDHGIDFPDPVFDDNGGITVSIGSEDGASGPSPDDPEVEAAMEECSAVNGGPMVASAKVGG